MTVPNINLLITGKKQNELSLHHLMLILVKCKEKTTGPSTEMLPAAVIENSLAVDAACSGNPGPMEYRGVHVASRQEIFISAR